MGDGVVLQMNTQTRINLRRGATESAGEAIELVSGGAEVLAGGPASARVTVAAGGGTVSATRARFNIRHLDGEVCVTCLAGQVDVAQGTQQARLDEGRQLRYGPAGLGVVTGVDTGPVVAWGRRALVVGPGARLGSGPADRRTLEDMEHQSPPGQLELEGNS